jgi:hypothetical protein
MSVTPRGMSVQEAYKEYRSGNFRVNRRYQRKLVWTVAEKEALIDSIVRGYPIPLILLAFTARPDGSRSFEILDGMQRLNAVFGFIENQFGLAGKFFDVEQLARAKQLAASGEFVARTDTASLLTAPQCANLLDYTFAVTEFPASNENAVNEVFGRINSYGHRLSDQEKRQAGVVSLFASTVREIATEIRGDVSQDHLDLALMPSISVDMSGEAPAYSVKADNTFWCKQGVLRRAQLRDSEDEQMIADLAITVLGGLAFPFSGGLLDRYYEPGTEEYAGIEKALAAYGVTKLKSDLIGTLSVLRETIEAVDASPGALRKYVHTESAGNPIKTAFYAVYNAFFQLCAVQKKSPGDEVAIMDAMKDLHKKLHIAAGQTRSEPRQQNIDVTIGLIQKFFVDKEPAALEHGGGSAIPFENALRRSRIETAAYECKQGLHRLDATRVEEPELLERIVETVCGIANIGPDSNGALFIGVADTKKDSDRISQLDAVQAAELSSRFVVGVDREVALRATTLEKYKKRIVDHIANSALSDELKASVLSRIDCITYRGKSVVCIWIPSQRQYSSVGDTVFVRSGSSTIEPKGARALNAVFERFK